MYPDQQLAQLADRSRQLRWRIDERRARIVLDTEAAARRVRWLDQAVVHWRGRHSFGGFVPPAIGVLALGLFARVAPRWAKMARWGAVLAGPVVSFFLGKRRATRR